jgi:hypothetical protein
MIFGTGNAQVVIENAVEQIIQDGSSLKSKIESPLIRSLLIYICGIRKPKRSSPAGGGARLSLSPALLEPVPTGVLVIMYIYLKAIKILRRKITCVGTERANMHTCTVIGKIL